MALKLNPLRGTDSLGKAIGLQTRFKNDYSGNKVVEDAFARRAVKEKEQKDLFSPLDIKVDTTKVEPYWAEKIQGEISNYANTYARAKGLNKDNAFSMVQPAYAKMQANIAGWLRSNEEFGKYKTQGDGHYKNTDLITKVRTPGAKDEEVLAFNEKIGNVQITPEGMFSYEPVKQYVKSPDFKPEDFSEMPLERVKSPIPGYYQTRKGKAVLPESYQNKIEQIALDPEFQASIIMEFPELKNADDNTKRSKVVEMAKVYVDAKMPPTSYKYDTERIPTSSESGSDKDKREKPIMGGPSTESLSVGTTGGGKTEVRKDVYYPWSADVPNSPETAVPLDGRVIDYETNKFISGDALGKIATFKPKKIYPQLIKGTGKTELYVIGTAQVEVTVGRNEKVIKEFNYKVPYDKVKDAIGAKYDLTDVDEKMKGTNLKPASGSQKQPEAPKQTQSKANVSYKYKRTNSKGVSIFSPDNQTWYDDKGNIIK